MQNKRVLTFAEFEENYNDKGHAAGNSEQDVNVMATAADKFTEPTADGADDDMPKLPQDNIQAPTAGGGEELESAPEYSYSADIEDDSIESDTGSDQAEVEEYEYSVDGPNNDAEPEASAEAEVEVEVDDDEDGEEEFGELKSDEEVEADEKAEAEAEEQEEKESGAEVEFDEEDEEEEEDLNV